MIELSGATGAFDWEADLHNCLDPIDPRAEWAGMEINYLRMCNCCDIWYLLNLQVLKNAKSQRINTLTSYNTPIQLFTASTSINYITCRVSWISAKPLVRIEILSFFCSNVIAVNASTQQHQEMATKICCEIRQNGMYQNKIPEFSLGHSTI